MTRRIALVISSVAMAVAMLAAPAEARDTGWDCPGCIVSTR